MGQAPIALQSGDIFCVRGDGWLSKAILWAQARHSEDGKAEYSHTGIIVKPKGGTLEALSTVRNENLFEYYRGYPVIIGRHKDMCPFLFTEGMVGIQDQLGKRYPWYRLLAHLFPAFAIHNNWSDRLVCSGLVGKFLYEAGCLTFYQGLTPDKMADIIVRDKGWSIIYRGEVP